MADESTLPDETARHDIEELALKWNGSAMGGLAEQEIRADFETSEVHDRAECREDENDLHNTETPAKATMTAEIPQDGSDQGIVGDRKAFMAEHADDGKERGDERRSRRVQMQKCSECAEQDEI